MWVTWVKCKLIQDMMVLTNVMNFHENRMKNGGDMSTRLNNIQNSVKTNEIIEAEKYRSHR